MRTTIFKRMAAMLLCALLCISLMGTAYAAEQEPPASGVSIQISLPSNWAATEAKVTFCITDDTGAGFASVKARVKGGNWQDVTNQLEQWDNRHYGQITVSDNCTVYVKVTGHDDKVYEESRYIECFDHTAPTVQAKISGQTLWIEASDGQSGVVEITVGGKRYTDLTGNVLELPLKDLASGQISIQAVDAAGNKSQTVKVQKPSEQKDTVEQPTTGRDPAPTVQKPTVSTTPVKEPATTSSTSTTNTTTEPADTSQASKPLTPDGQGAVVDNVTNEDGKEFFTISTKDENIFYLVIDKQRESDNVYFLDTVKESDLLSLAEKDKDTDQPSQSAVPDPEPEPVCNCTDKCAPGEVNTDCPVCILSMKDCTGKPAVAGPDTDQEPEKPEKSSNTTIILVVIAALAVGGAGYYLKIYKPKHDLDDADDFDDLTGGDDDETINEDDEDPVPVRDPYGEPEEPDYPEDDV